MSLYCVHIEVKHICAKYWLFVVQCVKHWEDRNKNTVLDNVNNTV